MGKESGVVYWDKRTSELKVTQWKNKKEPCVVLVQEWSILY